MCDKKNNVLFTDTECVVLSPYFKLTDESHVLLKVPRKDNMYSVDLKNFIPQGGLTYLFAKATPDESNLWHRRLWTCRKPALSFMRPFGCPVTILNTIDHLGKFDGKADEGSGPNWLFDIGALTKSMNYKPVVAGNQSNGNAGTKACNDAGKARMETLPGKDYILLPMWPTDPLFSQNLKDSPDARFKPSGEEEKKDAKDPGNESGNPTEGKDSEVPKVNAVDPKTSIELPNDPNIPESKDIVYSDDDEDVGAEADMNNLRIYCLLCGVPEGCQRASLMGKIEGKFMFVKTTRFEDLDFPDKSSKWKDYDRPVYQRVVKRAAVKHKEDGIFINQDKLISWQYKKQTVVANSTTEAEYIAASNCCGQFLGYCQANTVNGEVQLQALLDKNKVIITESTMRRDLQLEYANGVDCLPNAAIFEQLTLIEEHNKEGSNGYSGRSYPLFQTMMVQAHEEMGKGSEIPTDPYHTPFITQPSSSKPLRKQKSRKSKKRTEARKEGISQELLGLKRLRKLVSASRVESMMKPSVGDQEDASNRGGKIADIDADAEVTLIDETQGRNDDNLMFDIGVLDEQEVEVEKDNIQAMMDVTIDGSTITREERRAVGVLEDKVGYTLKLLKALILEQEVAKKQKIDDAKVDDDQEEARMKELMNIVPDEEEVAINV
ncbi:hypothetical protein Tco_0990576 [Tanacetum coccineum]|uniref:Uncharacterized protein n=1 Tax=Tanacetum coccineum TaxID=301880 RepID=A0ABQ5EY78_9ASTR